MKKENVILGAGPAGLFCSYELSKNNINSTIFEKDSKIGGICKTLDFDGFKTDIGPHVFFSKDEYINQIIKKILKNHLLKIKWSAGQHINGKIYTYPNNIFELLIKPGFFNSFRFIRDYIIAMFKRLAFKLEKDDFESFIINKIGRSLAEFNILNYTRKMWGLNLNEISQDWGANRAKLSLISALKNSLKKNNNAFYYPTNGIGELYDTVLGLMEKRTKIKFNSEITAINHKEDSICSINNTNSEIYAENLVSSISIKELLSLLKPNAPRNVLEASRKLKFRSQVYVFLKLNCKKAINEQWLYFPSKDIPFCRIMEPKNWSNKMSPPNKTSLFIEYFCFKNDPIWNMPKQKIFKLTSEKLEELGFIKKADVIGYEILKLENAYPLLTIDYTKNLNIVFNYLKRFKNLYVIGRNGLFVYNNQDHSIATGILAARSIIKKTEFNHKKIKPTYFESNYYK